MLRLVKLYHWNTTSYSHHHATDELYERMNEKMDRFTEVYMGKDGKRIGQWNEDMRRTFGDCASSSSSKCFAKTAHTFREFLIHLDHCLDPTRDSDLLNIRDDLLADVNQFLFLYTLR
jgi:DNA-binding ferritin-like protein